MNQIVQKIFNSALGKVQKRVFSKGVNPWFRTKNSKFFLACKMTVEVMLSYGLERKQVFNDDKNVSFVMSKTWVLSKGVNPWFR